MTEDQIQHEVDGQFLFSRETVLRQFVGLRIKKSAAILKFGNSRADVSVSELSWSFLRAPGVLSRSKNFGDFAVAAGFTLLVEEEGTKIVTEVDVVSIHIF